MLQLRAELACRQQDFEHSRSLLERKATGAEASTSAAALVQAGLICMPARCRVCAKHAGRAVVAEQGMLLANAQATANQGGLEAGQNRHHLAAHSYLTAHRLAAEAGLVSGFLRICCRNVPFCKMSVTEVPKGMSSMLQERDAATAAYSAGVEALALRHFSAARQCFQVGREMLIQGCVNSL